jgi:hypothetical protein
MLHVLEPEFNPPHLISEYQLGRFGWLMSLAFIVGVGGFLGMGEKDVAVPFSAVQVTNKNTNKWHLVMHSTKDALKNAKGFKYDRNAMTWISEDAPATTGAPANPPPRSNSR